MTSSRRCIVPGSFDPITLGHMDIIERASRMFDSVIVAVMAHHEKKSLIPTDRRVAMIERSCAHLPNVSAVSYDGLLTDYARMAGVGVIVRGLRSAADFDYEIQIATVYRHLAPELEILYLMAHPRHGHLSSTMVRQVATLGGTIEGMVPAVITDEIRSAIVSIKGGRP